MHALAIGGLIGLTILGAKAVKQVEHETVTLIAPSVSDYLPPISMKKNDTIGGGGGGGDHDKIPAVKGKLPKHTMEQITPPAMVVRNEHPKLAAGAHGGDAAAGKIADHERAEFRRPEGRASQRTGFQRHWIGRWNRLG